MTLAGTGFWAIMDQGLFAVSNFMLNVLLARWLGPAEYGVFGLAFALFLLLATAHTALATEPLLVFGSGRYRMRLATYVRTVMAGHWWLMRRAVVPFAGAGLLLWVVGESTLGKTLFTLALVAPLILFQWLLRRACYIESRPGVAAFAGAQYLVTIGVGVFALRAAGWLSGSTGLLLMGVASMVSTAIILRYVRSLEDAHDERENAARFERAIRHEHWRYGRWGIAAIALAWASTEVFYVLLSIIHGYGETGSLRAAMNVIAPAQQVFLALSTVALPVFVSSAREGVLPRTVGLTTGLFVAAAVVFSATIYVFARPLVGFLYGDAYTDIVPLVRIIAAVPLATAVARVASSVLHALEKPRDIYLGYLPGAVLALTVGIALTAYADTTGAAIGMVFATSGVAVMMGLQAVLRIRS